MGYYTPNEGKRLITIKTVMAKVNLTQGWIYSMIRAGKFPQGEKIGNSRLWKLKEVNAWIKERKEKELWAKCCRAMLLMDIRNLKQEANHESAGNQEQ